MVNSPTAVCSVKEMLDAKYLNATAGSTWYPWLLGDHAEKDPFATKSNEANSQAAIRRSSELMSLGSIENTVISYHQPLSTD